jgi:hypothetical protein
MGIGKSCRATKEFTYKETGKRKTGIIALS